MNIGIIGSVHIGGTAARLFAEVGHQIAVSNSRGPASLTSLVQQIGSPIYSREMTAEEAQALLASRN